VSQPLPDPARTPAPARPARWRRWGVKAATLVAAGLLLGWLYAWAEPRFYQPQTRAGFWRGILHGALMPVALPSLLMGRDVAIFAPNNDGRGYKIGYIFGINLCGLLFFGTAMRKGKDEG